MAEDKEYDEYDWGKRRIDEDPDFKKARAVLKEIMASRRTPPRKRNV